MNLDKEQMAVLSKEELAAIAKKKDLLDAYKFTFESNDGKRVLHDILKRGHIMNAAYVPDSHAMAYNEGMRSMALEILSILNIDMNDFLKRYSEGQIKENTYDRFK